MTSSDITSLRINDLVLQAYDGRRQLRTTPLRGIAWHRFTVDGVKITTGLDIHNWQQANPAASLTNGQNSYHFVVRVDGQIDQLMPLSEIGWHALGSSLEFLGCAAIGDFRVHQPATEQLRSIVLLTALLVSLTNGEVVRHDSLPGNYAHICPGKFLDVNAIAAEARNLSRAIPAITLF